MKFKSIKGTRDVLPSESFRWHQVEQIIRQVMHLYNYKEIRTPIFEETALFERGIGELTDIVGKEMYTFIDRGGTSLTLKPEMTAAVVRAYIQHNLGEQQPLVKVYYLSPMFRQERPQAGRLRQFHQFGAEAIGAGRPEVDSEVIALSLAVYQAVGLKNVVLKINSVGCENCRPNYKNILYKYLNIVKEQLSEESKKRVIQNPLRILDSKDERDKRLTMDAPLMKDHLCQACANHFERLQAVLHSLDISYEIDGRIVRGLDYYTKTAYEIISPDLGSQDALAGGGRYDLLVKELGGENTPAVGFAAGIERLMIAMEQQGLFQDVDLYPMVFIASADDAGRAWALKLACLLRQARISCEIDLLHRSLKAQMREAGRQSAKYVIIVGDAELKNQKVTLKHMQTGKQEEIAAAEIIQVLQNYIASQ